MKEIYRKMEDGTLAEISGKVAFIDSLTSESTADGLSANQGKVLNETKQDKSSLEADVQAKGFTKNVGTITEIKLNGTSVGTSGSVNLENVVVGCPFPIGCILPMSGSQDPRNIWQGTTWTKLADGTFLMADSTGGKATVNAELPNIAGSIGLYRGTVETHNGVFKNSYQGKEWWKEVTDPAQAGNDCRIDFSANKGQLKADGVTFETVENSVYKNGGKIIPHGTIKVVMWERIA